MKNVMFILFTLTLTAFSSLVSRAETTTLFKTLSCHEGVESQCQGCMWYELARTPNNLLSFQTQDDWGKTQGFEHVKLKKYETDGKAAFHFSGMSSREMRSDLHGLSAVAATLVKVVFDVKSTDGVSYFGTMKSKILGVTADSTPVRCELNAN